MKMMELSDYIRTERKAFEKMEKELCFLEGIKLPLYLRIDCGGANNLYSSDYSLATNFKIESRRKDGRMSGSAGPDGSYSTTIIEFYPQFYFLVPDQSKNRQVLVQHKGFEDDSYVVLKEFTQIEGWGCYHKKSGVRENYMNADNTISFFKREGVDKGMLEKLSRQVEKIYFGFHTK